MKLINIALSLLIIAGLSFVACQKNDDVVLPQTQEMKTIDLTQIKATVNDGKLRFESSDDFSQAIELLNAAKPEEVQRWEQSIGFKSAETMLQETLAQLELGAKAADLVSAAPELLKYEDEMISLRIPGAVTRLVNGDKLVNIGKSLYKFSEEGQSMSVDGSLSALTTAEQTKSTQEGAYFYFSNTPTVVAERACGYLIPDQVLVNSTNNRRSILSHTLTIIRSQQLNGLWTVENFLDVRGRAQKKNLFGDWSNYNTNHNLAWNFNVDISNRQLLLTVGGKIELEVYSHMGAKSEADSWITAYNVKFFKVVDVPQAALPYADPFWNYIVLNRHNHQGMNGAWNNYSCGL